MLLITPPNRILGKEIETGYRKWLRFGSVWDDPNLIEEEKIAISLQNILGEVPKDIGRWLPALLDFYACGEPPQHVSAPERLLDWRRDSATIWADFRVWLGIDLDHTNMHWWEFMALFGALPPDSRIKQTMSTRAIDLSKIKDPDTRAEYARQKRLVSLERTEDTEPIYERM